ncbi:hypothetical protein [Methanocella arvoryzae]|nr:hypothetical protein [Methanocella arvoryzae]
MTVDHIAAGTGTGTGFIFLENMGSSMNSETLRQGALGTDASPSS